MQAASHLHSAGWIVWTYAREAEDARMRIEKESRPRREIRDLVLRNIYDFNVQPGNADRYRHIEQVAQELSLAEDTVGREVLYLVEIGHLKAHNQPAGVKYPRVSITAPGQDAVDDPKSQVSPAASSAVTYHTTFNAPVAQSIIGGSSHVQQASHISFPVDHQSQEILQIIAAMRDAIGADDAASQYAKEPQKDNFPFWIESAACTVPSKPGT